MARIENKHEIEHVNPPIELVRSITGDVKERDEPAVQRQELDKLTVFQAARRYRKVGLLCLIAAFSAALDGYQGEPYLMQGGLNTDI